MADEKLGVEIVAKTDKFESAAKAVDSAIQTMGEQIDKASASYDGFAVRAQKLQDQFRNGKLGIKEYESAVKRLGQAYSVTAKQASAMSRNKVLTLQYTASDVVASLASGTSPMTILLQQGGQVAQVFGGASLAIMGFGAAVGAVGYMLYSAAANIEKAKEAANQFNAVMEVTGRERVAEQALNSYVEQLASLPGINEEAARSIVTELGTAANVSTESFSKLRGIVRDFAYATNTEATAAAKTLAKMMEDPSRAADKLAESYNNILTPAEYEQVKALSELGDKMRASEVIAEALERRFSGLADRGMTPAQRGAHMLGQAFSWLGEQINLALNPIPPLTSALGHLADAYHQLFGGGEAPVGNKDASSIDAALNKPIMEALQLRRQLQGSLDEEGRIKKQIQTVTEGYNNAVFLGMTEEAEKLKQTKTLLEDKIAKIELLKLKEQERADKERERELQEEARKEEQARKEQQRLARQATQLKDNQLQGMQQVQRSRGTTAEDTIHLQYEERKVTLEQEYQLLKQNYEKQYQAENDLLSQRRSLWTQGSEEWNRINSQMLVAHENLQQNMVKLERQRLQQQKQVMREYEAEQKKLRTQEEQEWRGSVNSIVGGFTAGIKGMITQQDTLLRATGRVVEGMLTAFLGYFERKAEMWVMDQILGSTTASTEAFGSIMSDAARAGAAAYASTAAIPIIGPGLAPAASAEAYSATAAYSGLIAFDKGTNYVPSDMKAQIHEGERIVPKADNEKLMRAVEGDQGGRGGDTYVIKALDSRDVKRFLQKNKKALVKQGSRALRGGGRVAYAGE